MSRAPAESMIVPGVLVAIDGHGVLLTGVSGIGKSDAALTLLANGHALVADDAVRLYRKGRQLFGCCPVGGGGRLCLRDLGIINVATVYGSEAVAPAADIALEVELCHERGDNHPEHALHGRYGAAERLGVRLPRVTLSACRQRPLAALLESALRIALTNRTTDPTATDFPTEVARSPSFD